MKTAHVRRFVTFCLCALVFALVIVTLRPGTSVGLPPPPSVSIDIGPAVPISPGLSIDPDLFDPGVFATLFTTSTTPVATTAAAPATTAPPTATTTVASTTTTLAPTTTGAPTTTEMVPTTIGDPTDAAAGLGGGWIALIVVLGAAALGGLGTMFYLLGKNATRGGTAGSQSNATRAFCAQCGSPLTPGLKFCAKCGKPV